MKTFTGHSEWVRQVKVSPDGEYSSTGLQLGSSMTVVFTPACCSSLCVGSLLASCSNDQVGCMYVCIPVTCFENVHFCLCC